MQRSCSVDGCERSVTARGWCDAHYRRWRRHGDPLGGRTSPRIRSCEIEGCERSHYARGWCHLHYGRWLTQGSPEPHRPTLEERFWAKVDQRDPDECWEWQGARTVHGYGRFDGGWLASRFVWTLANGEIPPRTVVRHRCDNPSCCNPSHLELGSHLDNMRDMVRKGRSLTGERHHQAKLDESTVRDIRKASAAGETQRSLATRYGVATGTVADVIYRRTWGHVS